MKQHKREIKKLEQITKEVSKDFEVQILEPVNALEITYKKKDFACTLITSESRNNRILYTNKKDKNLAQQLKNAYEKNLPELGPWDAEYYEFKFPTLVDIERHLSIMN
jgi:hypothetical protein